MKKKRKITQKIAKNEFGFDDFLKQIQQIKKMGNMKDPHGNVTRRRKKAIKMLINDDAFKHIEAIIHSMTPDEKEDLLS